MAVGCSDKEAEQGGDVSKIVRGTWHGDGGNALLAVSVFKAVEAPILFSRLVLTEPPLALSSESGVLSIFRADPSGIWHEGRLLAAWLGTRLVARLWDCVPPGENVPERANEVRLRALENASTNEKAARLAWCAGSTLPLYLDFGISFGL